MKNKLIELNNHQIEFRINGELYLIRRIFVESKFKNIYWFAGNLYNEIIMLYNKNKEWFNKYKK